jgi:hypothetical protein
MLPHSKGLEMVLPSVRPVVIEKEGGPANRVGVQGMGCFDILKNPLELLFMRLRESAPFQVKANPFVGKFHTHVESLGHFRGQVVLNVRVTFYFGANPLFVHFGPWVISSQAKVLLQSNHEEHEGHKERMGRKSPYE